MALRTAAVFAVIICLAGCDTKETLTSKQNRSGWQRQAGHSPQQAYEIARQSDKNSEQLKQLMQSSSTESLSAMHGKLVQIEGEVAAQTGSSWTLRTNDGWTIIAPVSDLTPHSDTSRDVIQTCSAQGVISRIDPQTRTISLDDVELALQMKPAMSETLVTK